MICGFDLQPVSESGAENDFRQLVMSIEPAPAFLGALDELEHHRERCRVREAAFGSDGAVAHGGERALDRVRGSKVFPMLGGKS